MEENLYDALIMAGAILIFVIALTVSMSSFTEMRTQIDEIVEMDSRVDLVKNDKGYLNYISTNPDSLDIRIVGIETLVSSMYRVSKENYVVYIKASDYGEAKTMRLKDKGLSAQYYGAEEIIKDDDNILQITINGANSDATTLLKNTDEGGKGLYDELKDKKFKEYLGVYQENTGASEANRTTYRVITYVEVEA